MVARSGIDTGVVSLNVGEMFAGKERTCPGASKSRLMVQSVRRGQSTIRRTREKSHGSYSILEAIPSAGFQEQIHRRNGRHHRFKNTADDQEPFMPEVVRLVSAIFFEHLTSGQASEAGIGRHVLRSASLLVWIRRLIVPHFKPRKDPFFLRHGIQFR